ncbi:hypothetical protein FRC02_003015 [Tulasnella sp. 418]|nr:hypothetical protein FRC02_003015 [Tulasnella sp. 418]
MAREVRSRLKAPTPPPPGSVPSQRITTPNSSSRYPPRQYDYVDGDERKAAASSHGLRHVQRAFGGLKMRNGEWKLLLGIVVLAFFVRFHGLSHPDSVVFDEVHFGKFAGKYINMQYYVDVHPPLAKLLFTFVAFVFGFDGVFDFKDIGLPYPENVPYVAMRVLPALMGVGVVPIAYLTLRALDCRVTTAVLGSLFITFENGLITQSRLILLDSPLIFFTALTNFFWVGFTNEQFQEPFTEDWWTWLILTGLSLGAVASCKWVGLFTIATVGACTIKQLWDMLGDLKVSPRLWIRHFVARALCLIGIPIAVYMAVFQVHFSVLRYSGDGDGFMSAEFQHTLFGKRMHDTYADVAYGSDITIRHLKTQGGYLHSHMHNYPTGSKQQQITLYPHDDHNNNWRIIQINMDGQPDHDWANSEPTYIKHGMQVRLEHITTSKRLHSHDVRPPVSEVEFQNEVSGYGFPGFVGDANDNWVVEIEYADGRDREARKRLKTIRSKFRLRHALTGCYLFSHKVKLPEWGFEQQEVTCNKNAVKGNSLWYIETNSHPQLPKDAEKINYNLPGFFGKFWELQKVMWTTNAGLTDRHSYDSRPSSWPTLKRGINFWVKDHTQIYLIGNPIVWWLSTAAIVFYAVIRGFLILRAKRGYKDFNHSFVVKYDNLCGFLTLGWFLHYFPFYLMERQLFLHHYFPALYFAILLSCGVFDLFTSSLKAKFRLQAAAFLAVIAILTYWKFSPLTYGEQWTKKGCDTSRWVKEWDFACNEFPETYSQYELWSQVPVSPTANQVSPEIKPDGQLKIDEKFRVEQTESVIGIPVEPGRNVFEDKVQKDKSLTAAKEEPVHHEQHVETTIIDTSKGQKLPEGVEQPPPLPPQEPADMAVESKIIENQMGGKEAQQQPPKVVVPPANEQAKQTEVPVEDVVKEKVKAAEASTESKEVLSEEERIRQELFPDQ